MFRWSKTNFFILRALFLFINWRISNSEWARNEKKSYSKSFLIISTIFLIWKNPRAVGCFFLLVCSCSLNFNENSHELYDDKINVLMMEPTWFEACYQIEGSIKNLLIPSSKFIPTIYTHTMRIEIEETSIVFPLIMSIICFSFENIKHWKEGKRRDWMIKMNEYCPKHDSKICRIKFHTAHIGGGAHNVTARGRDFFASDFACKHSKT